MWKVITWTTLVVAIGWFVVTGLWAYQLTEAVAYSWVGEPEPIFLPYVDTHVLVAPAVPIYAIFTYGDWMPLISIVMCTSGSYVLWSLSKKAGSRAYSTTNQKEIKQ